MNHENTQIRDTLEQKKYIVKKYPIQYTICNTIQVKSPLKCEKMKRSQIKLKDFLLIYEIQINIATKFTCITQKRIMHVYHLLENYN